VDEVDRYGNAILIGQRQGKAIFRLGEQWLDGDAAFGRILFQRALEFLVTVAEQRRAFG